MSTDIKDITDTVEEVAFGAAETAAAVASNPIGSVRRQVKSLERKGTPTARKVNRRVNAGIDAAKRIHDLCPETHILMLSMHENERYLYEALGDYKAPLLTGDTNMDLLTFAKNNRDKYWNYFQVDPPEIYYGRMFPRFLDTVAAGGVWKPINNKVHIIREQNNYNMQIAKEVVATLPSSRRRSTRPRRLRRTGSTARSRSSSSCIRLWKKPKRSGPKCRKVDAFRKPVSFAALSADIT